MFCSKVRNIKIALISNLKSFFINANYCKELSKLKCGLDKKLCQIILKWMGVSQIQFLHPLKFFSLIKNIFFPQITDNLSRPQFERIFFKVTWFFSSNWNDVIKILLSARRRPFFVLFLVKSWNRETFDEFFLDFHQKWSAFVNDESVHSR